MNTVEKHSNQLNLSLAVQAALEKYDQQKGFLRRIFGDTLAVRKLRDLDDNARCNIFKVYECFVGSFLKEEQLSYRIVYQAVRSAFSR